MPLPLYLYTGPEAGEKADQIALLKEALKKKFGSMDESVYYGTDVDISEVTTQLLTESLFTAATCVVIKNAELIKDKKDVDLLGQWVETAEKNKSENNMLILVSEEIKVDSKLEKLVPPSNKKVFWEMFEDRKEQWLYNFFKKNGLGLTPDSAEAILEMVENNTEALRNECSRFFYCFPAGHQVTLSEVEQILSHNKEETAFTLFDAMIESGTPQMRLETCLNILQKLMMSSENGAPPAIIAGLVFCFRKLSLWQSVHAGGKAPSDIELKKYGFASKPAQKQYARASRVWNAGQVTAIIALLAKTDVECRSMGTAFWTTQMNLMLYEIIIKNGAYCSKYETDL